MWCSGLRVCGVGGGGWQAGCVAGDGLMDGWANYHF